MYSRTPTEDCGAIDFLRRERRATVVVRRALLAIVVFCYGALAGCFEYTEDSQGNLQSVGLPGMSELKSKTPPASLSPADMGMSPEDAAKVSEPVLVIPPDQSNKRPRYRYYETGSNNCQQDLAKLLAQRAASNATGKAPYCAPFSSAPPS
ncbi:MAG: hypothetical protein ACREQH_07375 [Candidatus Binatus sp.]